MRILSRVALTITLLIGWLVLVAPTTVAAGASQLLVHPKTPLVGERVTVSGRLGTKAGSVIELHVRKKGRWSRVATSRTKQRGTYSFAFRLRGDRTLRVKLRSTKQVSRVRTIRGATDSVTLKLTGSGTRGVAVATSRVPRASRPVTLQRWTGKTWTKVGSTQRQDARGRTTFALTELKHSGVKYRAVAQAWRSAPPAASPATNFAPATFSPLTFGSPVVQISTVDPSAVITKQVKTDATMRIDDSSPLDLTIKGRGNSTWNHNKKPYRLSLSSKVPLLGLPADKNWVLLANYGDRSLVRTTAALNLGAKTSLAWTPRHAPVELVLNGKYLGAYLLVEHVRRGPGRVSESTNLFEIDGRIDANIEQDGEQGFRTSRRTPVMLADPDDVTDLEGDLTVDEVRDHLDTFESALATGDFAAWSGLVDLDAFVDFYLVTELFKGIDADCYTSCFFTWTRGEKIAMGPLWDFDNSAGYAPSHSTSYLKDPAGWWVNGLHPNVPLNRPDGMFVWLEQMWRTPEFRAAAAQRWGAVMEAGTLVDVPAGVDRAASELGVSAMNNWERWSGDPDTSKNHIRASSPEGEVAYVRDWLAARIRWLDDHMTGLASLAP